MKFTEITPAKFRQYAKNSPYHSFMQTPEIATYREHNGWKAQYFAVVEDKPNTTKTSKTSKNTKTAKTTKKTESDPKILAATLLVSRPSLFGYRLYTTPGGPLLDLEDTKLTNFFFSHLIDYAKSHKGYTLRIDPYYELIERDRNGEIVPNGFNHEKALKNIQKFGFKQIGIVTHPIYLFALDINGRTPDELMASFKSNTRNHIRHAIKNGVTIRELAKDELRIFKDITASTAERRNFHDLPLSYYEQMYDLFYPRDEVKFLVAEADIDGKITPLSAAMFILYGDEIIYLSSGSKKAYMTKYNAQYLIQWHMIKYAAEHGFGRYNFYGIQGLPDPQSPDYGIYNFKKGFGGSVIELIGSFELPLNQPIYRLYQLTRKINQLRRHM